MKIIFIKDLKDHGKKNEIKEVKDGFAINYLIKNGYAVKYSEKSLERLNKELDEQEVLEQKEIEKYNKIKKELDKKELTFKLKVGEKDKVFGSITSKQIEETLLKEGYNISKKNINMKSLDKLGNHTVEVILYKDIKSNIKINVIKE